MNKNKITLSESEIEDLNFELGFLDEQIQKNEESFQSSEEGKKILSRIMEIQKMVNSNHKNNE